MITNRITGEWLRLCADLEHTEDFGEFAPAPSTEITIEVLPGILRPQALDIPATLRDRLALEFATGAPIHV